MRMDLIFFTKSLKGLSAEETAEKAREIGVDGLDLTVRGGYCVNPGDFETTLAPAMEVFANAGLSVPLVTLEGSWTDPSQQPVRDLAAACAGVGIPYLKLGYWGWDPGEGFWPGLDRVRSDLAGFAEIAAEAGVCFLLHNHSGHRYGSHATGGMLALEGIDPDRVGLYIDPGHLALEGELIAMAVDIARPSLRMVAAKNVRYRFVANGRDSHWDDEWVQLSEGLQDWPGTIRALNAAGYDGPISLHGQYSGTDGVDDVLARASRDVDYLRELIG